VEKSGGYKARAAMHKKEKQDAQAVLVARKRAENRVRKYFEGNIYFLRSTYMKMWSQKNH
jgi:hypothetical protein